MPPAKRQHYTRFPASKYTTALKREQEELIQRLVSENKNIKAKKSRLKCLQERDKLIVAGRGVFFRVAGY